ncbi:MAG: lipocalin-like domain-containing protein [Desulfobacterales bacterium]
MRRFGVLGVASIFFKGIKDAFLLFIGLTAAFNPIFSFHAAAGDADGYLEVTGPCRLAFPVDHGAHPGYRTEWWYFTGNLATPDGRPFGFQVTIFRRQIGPASDRRSWPEPASAWRTQQLFLGHIALSDISGRQHLFAEDMSRGALGLAGVIQTGVDTTVFLKSWKIDIGPRVQRLQAATEAFAIDLDLVPLKSPVQHGDQGYSRKGDTAERASCYYSFTRLKTEGTIRLYDRELAVNGLSWMDHEFSTADLQPGIVGWDWFSLQLDNGTELMLYRLRQEDGQPNPASSGTLVNADQTIRHLSADDVKLTVLENWQSPRSGGRYPAAWQVTVSSAELRLSIVPNLADQEMRTPGSTAVTYWEGSVSITGEMAGQPVKGKGYIELTGYVQAFEQPL